MTEYKIVPKRDFGPMGFLINGEYVTSGFVVTDGFCNVMPGATWFRTEEDAQRGIAALEAANGDADTFWKIMRENRA